MYSEHNRTSAHYMDFKIIYKRGIKSCMTLEGDVFEFLTIYTNKFLMIYTNDLLKNYIFTSSFTVHERKMYRGNLICN